MIEFTIPAIPVAQPRQRHRVVEGANGAFARNYTPAKHPVNAFKACAQHAFAAAYSGPPLTGALSISVLFIFPRPKSKVWKRRPMPREPHTKTPDMDNLLKSLKDSLKGLAYVDDAQIALYTYCMKVIAGGTEQPRVEVSIEEHTHAEPATKGTV